jgi:hypothetical protein
MFSQLKKITDERSVLLMYLADELSASDRQEVERRLEGDARLAAELGDLQAAHASYLEMMSMMEAATPDAVPVPAAAQRASRAVRQWATRRLANPIPVSRDKKFIARWVLPIAAAAAVVVAVTWWGVDKGDNRIIQQQEEQTDQYAIHELRDVNHQDLGELVDTVVRNDSGSGEDEATADVDQDQPVVSADMNDDINLFLGMDDQTNAKEGTR